MMLSASNDLAGLLAIIDDVGPTVGARIARAGVVGIVAHLHSAISALAGDKGMVRFLLRVDGV